jgi:hypothetical protein
MRKPYPKDKLSKVSVVGDEDTSLLMCDEENLSV